MSSSNFQNFIYHSEKDITAYEKEILKKNIIRIKKIRNFVEKSGNNKKIMELGCATGLITKNLTDNNEVWGVDIVDNFLTAAEKKGLNTKKSDLEKKLPFKDNQFDIIIASEIIEHVVDTDKLLSECNRLLKNNGCLVLTIPNLRNIFSPWILLFLNRPPAYAARYRSPHVRDFTYPIIKKALKNNNFKITKKTGTNCYLPYFWRIANSKISSLFGSLLPTWSKEIIIKAKKTGPAKYNQEKIIKTYQEGCLK